MTDYPINPEKQGIRRQLPVATSGPFGGQDGYFAGGRPVSGEAGLRQMERAAYLDNFRAQQLEAVAQSQGLRNGAELQARNAEQDAQWAAKQMPGSRIIRPGMPTDSQGLEQGGFWRGARRVTDGNLNRLTAEDSRASGSYDQYKAGLRQQAQAGSQAPVYTPRGLEKLVEQNAQQRAIGGPAWQQAKVWGADAETTPVRPFSTGPAYTPQQLEQMLQLGVRRRQVPAYTPQQLEQILRQQYEAE